MKIFSVLFLFSTFIIAVTPDERNIANVEKREGMYIFWMSTPAKEYEVLATFTVKQKFTGEPKEQLRTALAKLHKEYPQADGLIFLDENMQQAQAVRFK